MATKDMPDVRDLNPGFFELYLSITQSGVDGDQIKYLKGEQELELLTAHKCFHPVIKNIIAMLLHSQPHRGNDAICILEEVRKSHPTNLNTLANLGHIYRRLGRSQDKDDCVKQIDEIIADDSETAKIEKARCLLEQGYILIADLHEEVKESSVKKLDDVCKRLQTLLQSSSGYSHNAVKKQCLDQTMSYISSAKRNFMVIPENLAKDNIKKFKEATEKFKSGLTLLKCENKNDSSKIPVKTVAPITEGETYIWMVELGKAYMKLANVEQGSNTFEQAAETFMDAIHSLSTTDIENSSISKERAFAYLGHIFVTKKRFLSENMLEKIRSAGLDDTMECFEQDPKVEDRVVYNRYALVLSKMKKFDKAEDLLKRSLAKWPNFNWFAFSCQLELYNKKYKERAARNQRSKTGNLDESLTKAVTAGRACLKWRCTSFILYNLSNACYCSWQDMANDKKNRSQANEFIHEAIDYLHRALERQDCYNEPRVYTLYGQCLFAIGELKTAIEIMKKAIIYESDWMTSTHNFTYLLRYLLEHYKSKSKDPVLTREIWSVLEECHHKYENSMTHNLTGLANNYPFIFFDLIRQMIREKRGKATKFIVKTCMRTLLKHDGKKVQKHANKIKEELPENLGDSKLFDETHEEDNEIGSVESTRPSRDLPLLPHDFRYDFFVSHSHKDQGWVKTFLLTELEKNNLADDNSGFRGCYANRDFVPGKNITRNIIDAVNHSYKVIVILSKPYVESRWCKYEMDATLNSSLQDKSRNGCLIPILFENCEIPRSIAHLTYLDFTGKTRDWWKLRAVLTEPMSVLPSNV